MEIRAASRDDALNIAAIGICVWLDTYATDGMRKNISDYVFTEFKAQNILKLINSQIVIVAEINKHLIGYAVYDSKTEELENLYVLPSFQRTGVGKALLNRIQSGAKSVNLSCWEKNKSAIAFYIACGFKVTGETYFNLEGESHRNVVLTCNT